jgi:hypothetical protein
MAVVLVVAIKSIGPADGLEQIVIAQYVQLGASKPVSNLLTTISSFMFAGSSINRRLASSSYCLVVW